MVRPPGIGGSTTGTPQDPYTRGLQDRVEAIRSDDEWREANEDRGLIYRGIVRFSCYSENDK